MVLAVLCFSGLFSFVYCISSSTETYFRIISDSCSSLSFVHGLVPLAENITLTRLVRHIGKAEYSIKEAALCWTLLSLCKAKRLYRFDGNRNDSIWILSAKSSSALSCSDKVKCSECCHLGYQSWIKKRNTFKNVLTLPLFAGYSKSPLTDSDVSCP